MNEELQELVRSPREDLDIELKQWMDPADKVVQAKFAKALLALRNHGGGYLLIGFKNTHPATQDSERPADLSGFSTDYFNDIVKRYAEPLFHVMSHIIADPVTGLTFPVVVVPGGAKVPVRCKSDSPDAGKSAKLDAYYIRRPGPASEPPQSGAEWDGFLNRCLLNRREELLGTIAGLLGAGRTMPLALMTGAPPVHPFNELRAFEMAALSRLEQLQNKYLPADAAARFPHGRYVLAARIVGQIKPATSKEVLDLIASLRKYTGWPPLAVLTRPELAPYSTESGMVECWLGKKDPDNSAYADYWRASPDGKVLLVRGYQEDALDPMGAPQQLPPGVGFELTLSTWRVGEFLLRVRELGTYLAPDGFTLQFIGEWHGLEDRRLYSHGNRRMIFDEHVARAPSFRCELEVSPEEIDSGLAVAVSKIVGPLLRQFAFFEPPERFFEEEVGKLLRKEFS